MRPFSSLIYPTVFTLLLPKVIASITAPLRNPNVPFARANRSRYLGRELSQGGAVFTWCNSIGRPRTDLRSERQILCYGKKLSGKLQGKPGS